MTRFRLGVGELVSAGCALALLILLFAAEWYGVAGVPDPTHARPAIPGTESGWDALSITRWVIVLTAIVAIGAVGVRVSQREHGRQTDASALVMALGLLCSLLLTYRVLIALPSPDKVIDQKLGAVLGLACAIGIALGGHQSIVDRRERPPDVLHRRRPVRGDGEPEGAGSRADPAPAVNGGPAADGEPAENGAADSERMADGERPTGGEPAGSVPRRQS